MQSNLRAERWGCILIGGPRNLTSAVQASLKKRHETREQLMEEKDRTMQSRLSYLSERSNGQGMNSGWRQIRGM